MIKTNSKYQNLFRNILFDKIHNAFCKPKKVSSKDLEKNNYELGVIPKNKGGEKYI